MLEECVELVDTENWPFGVWYMKNLKLDYSLGISTSA